MAKKQESSSVPELVQVVYHGPSGCLIAEGYEMPQGEAVQIPRDVAVRVLEYMPGHDLAVSDLPKDVVPLGETGLALVHKGEEIIPADAIEEPVAEPAVEEPVSEPNAEDVAKEGQ